MECKLVLEVFRFDCKTDYLPYYQKVVLKLDNQKSVADLLAMIKKDESSFEYPVEDNAAIIINGKALFISEKIEDITEFFGTNLQLDPLSSKHSVKDLRMNRDDFDKRFDLLDAFVESKDKKVYKSYIREHYVSPILNLEEDYIADGLFAFAYDMVHKYPQMKTKILEIISKQDNGLWLHVNISNKLYPHNSDLERKIVYLKNAILEDENITNSFVKSQRNLSRGM